MRPSGEGKTAGSAFPFVGRNLSRSSMAETDLHYGLKVPEHKG